MNETGMQIFNNGEFGKIRFVDVNGKMYAIANDVAKALEYVRPYEAVSAHTGRRSFITNLSIMGLTTKQISLMVGHTQQRITDIYDKTKEESNAVLVAAILKHLG